jgi:hypothetical protein
MKIHPIFVIFFGLFLCSIGFNICLWESNKKLVYRIQKLETGPAKGLFKNDQNNNDKSQLNDEQLNRLIEEMLKEMARDRIV